MTEVFHVDHVISAPKEIQTVLGQFTYILRSIGSCELPFWLWDPGIYMDMIHDHGFNPYRYFSMGFWERRIQYGNDGRTVMIRVVQRQHGRSFLILAWDPVIPV